MGSNNSIISLVIFFGCVVSSCTSERNILHKSHVGTNVPFLNSLPRGGGGDEGGWFGKTFGGGTPPNDNQKKDQSQASFSDRNEFSEENRYRQAPSLPYNEQDGNGFDESCGLRPPPPPPPPHEEEGNANDMNYNEKYRNPDAREMEEKQALENDYYTPQSQEPYSQNNYPPAPQQQQYYPYQGEQQYMQQENYHPYQHQDELFNAQIRNLQIQISNYTDVLSQLQTEKEEHQDKIESLEEELLEKQNLLETEVVINEQFKVNITSFESEIQDYQSQIIELNQTILQEIEVNNVQSEEYKELLKSKENDVEELAFLIEEKQWAEQRKDNQKNVAEKKSKKSGSFFTWMTNMIFGDEEESEEQSDDERMQSSLSHAKSTLLTALQTERESVSFLENFIIDLEQNITSLSSIIKSKSDIISELNSRIDVFEEDKLILRAALKQLQKEMKAEVNKQEILKEEVLEKEDEMEQLKEEMASLRNSTEIAFNEHMMEKMELKNSTLVKSEETRQIHYYVDILEGRLANLLMDFRKEKERCQELEQIIHTMEEINQQNLNNQTTTEDSQEESNHDDDVLGEEIITSNVENIGKVVKKEEFSSFDSRDKSTGEEKAPVDDTDSSSSYEEESESESEDVTNSP